MSRGICVGAIQIAIRKISRSLCLLSMFSRRQWIGEPPWWPVIPVHQLTHLRIQEVDLFLDPETALDELLGLVKGEISVAPHVHPQLVENIVMGIEHADEVTLIPGLPGNDINVVPNDLLQFPLLPGTFT